MKTSLAHKLPVSFANGFLKTLILYTPILYLLILYALSSSIAQATVITYPTLTGADHAQHGSSRYSVRVKAANSTSFQYAYTYRSDNDIEDNAGDFCSNPAGGCGPQQHPYSRAIMTHANHWASFDSDDNEIEFKIKAWWGAPTGYKILPEDLPRSDESLVGDQLTFKLTRPANGLSGVQFSIEFFGNNYNGHPLFIFANPLFAGCPAGEVPPGDTWVADGRHVTVGRPGEVSPSQFNWGLWNNASICIPGGAYVKGSLQGNNVSNVSITGRGILSGIHKQHSTKPDWVGNLISINGSGSSNNRISGITMTDSPRGAIEAYGQLAVENVKLMGWHVNSDGILVGPGSTVDNVFLKVNDDAVKLMFSNVQMRNLVVWQQAAGSVVQLAWNNQWTMENSTVSNIRLIHVDQNIAGRQDLNSSIIAARNMMGGTIRNVKISDVVAYDYPYSVLLLQLNDQLVYDDTNRQNSTCQYFANPRPGGYSCDALDGNGQIDMVTLENVKTPPQLVNSLLNVNGDEQAGIIQIPELSNLDASDEMSRIRLINVEIGGRKLVHWNTINPNHVFVTEQLDIVPGSEVPVGDAAGLLAY